MAGTARSLMSKIWFFHVKSVLSLCLTWFDVKYGSGISQSGIRIWRCFVKYWIYTRIYLYYQSSNFIFRDLIFFSLDCYLFCNRISNRVSRDNQFRIFESEWFRIRILNLIYSISSSAVYSWNIRTLLEISSTSGQHNGTYVTLRQAGNEPRVTFYFFF